MSAAAVAAVRMHGHDAGCRFRPLWRFDRNRQPILMAGPVDPDLIADIERRQQRNRPEPFEIHLVLAEIAAQDSCFDAFSQCKPVSTPGSSPRACIAGKRSDIAWHTGHASVKPARGSALDPGRFFAKDCRRNILREGINVTDPADDRLLARNDLAWAISVG